MWWVVFCWQYFDHLNILFNTYTDQFAIFTCLMRAHCLNSTPIFFCKYMLHTGESERSNCRFYVTFNIFKVSNEWNNTPSIKTIIIYKLFLILVFELRIFSLYPTRKKKTTIQHIHTHKHCLITNDKATVLPANWFVIIELNDKFTCVMHYFVVSFDGILL